MTILARDRDIVFIDCETSGLDPDYHEILEFCAMRMTPRLEERARLVIKCKMRYPERATPDALAVNGYTEEAWKDAFDVKDLLYAFSDFMKGEPVIIVGQNPHFDWTFLRAAYRAVRLESGDEGFRLPEAKYLIDTASLVGWPLHCTGGIESIRLEAICNYFGVSNDGSHSALSDVKRTARVYGARFSLLPNFLGEAVKP